MSALTFWLGIGIGLLAGGMVVAGVSAAGGKGDEEGA